MSHKVTREEAQFCRSQGAIWGGQALPLPQQRGCCSHRGVPQWRCPSLGSQSSLLQILVFGNPYRKKVTFLIVISTAGIELQHADCHIMLVFVAVGFFSAYLFWASLSSCSFWTGKPFLFWGCRSEGRVYRKCLSPLLPRGAPSLPGVCVLCGVCQRSLHLCGDLCPRWSALKKGS